MVTEPVAQTEAIEAEEEEETNPYADLDTDYQAQKANIDTEYQGYASGLDEQYNWEMGRVDEMESKARHGITELFPSLSPEEVETIITTSHMVEIVV